MSQQLDLITGQPALPPSRPDALTDRQRLALEHIGQHQPVASDELGAYLHEDRQRRGGKGHDRDTRCDWCQSEGNVVAASLRSRGLVIRKRTVGWVLTDWKPQPVDDGRPGPGDLPEGF